MTTTHTPEATVQSVQPVQFVQRLREEASTPDDPVHTGEVKKET